MNNEWRDHRSTDRPNFHSKFMRWSSRGASSGRNTSRLPTKKVQRSESEPPRHSNCTVLRLRLNRPVPDRILRFNRSGSGETRSPEENCDSIAIGNSHVRVCTKSRPPPDLSLSAKSRFPRSHTAERQWVSLEPLWRRPRKFDTRWSRPPGEFQEVFCGNFACFSCFFLFSSYASTFGPNDFDKN